MSRSDAVASVGLPIPPRVFRPPSVDDRDRFDLDQVLGVGERSTPAGRSSRSIRGPAWSSPPIVGSWSPGRRPVRARHAPAGAEQARRDRTLRCAKEQRGLAIGETDEVHRDERVAELTGERRDGGEQLAQLQHRLGRGVVRARRLAVVGRQLDRARPSLQRSQLLGSRCCARRRAGKAARRRGAGVVAWPARGRRSPARGPRRRAPNRTEPTRRDAIGRSARSAVRTPRAVAS